jgi:hypothetical protein
MTFRRRAILVMAVVSAFCASNTLVASAGSFTASQYPVTVKGTQVSGEITGSVIEKAELQSVAGFVKCNVVSYSGKFSETSTEAVATPTFSGCTIAGLGITTTGNGCLWRHTAGETLGEGKMAASVHIECPGGGQIELVVTGSTCKIKVPPQTVESGITAENEGTSPSTIKATVDVTTLRYTVENGNKCPNQPANGEYKNGVIKAVGTLQGEDGLGKAVGISIK